MSASSSPRKSGTASRLSPMSPGPVRTKAKPTFAPYKFSKGHGAYQATGGVKKGKTVIRPDAVESVNANRSLARAGGKARLAGGDIAWTFVPRRSDPTKFRAIGTKQSAENTSFPASPANVPSVALARAKLKLSDLVDEPHSPRASHGSK